MKAQEANEKILNNKVQEIIDRVIKNDGCAFIKPDCAWTSAFSKYPTRVVEYLEDQEVVQALEKLDYKITKMMQEVTRHKYEDVKFLGIFKKTICVEYKVPETWFVVET